MALQDCHLQWERMDFACPSDRSDWNARGSLEKGYPTRQSWDGSPGRVPHAACGWRGTPCGRHPSDCLKAYGRSPWERYRTRPGGRGEIPHCQSRELRLTNTPWQEDVWDASYPPHTHRWDRAAGPQYHCSREQPWQNVLTPEFRPVNFGLIDGDRAERVGTLSWRWRLQLVTTPPALALGYVPASRRG